jgi:type I restriction enzyme S subunit
MSKRKTPILRFKGFNNAWEQRKLGDYGSVKMNKRIFKNQTSPNGDIPFYKIGTFGKKADSFISKKLYEKYKVKYPYPKIGDLLISASGSIGRIIEYKGKKAYFQDSNIVWLSHNSKLLNIYLKQYYQRINWNNIEGTTIKRLYNKDILTTHISVPNIKEQKRIGNLLNLVDNLLVLQKRKYEELKLLKKALMQNMFADNAFYPNLRFKGFVYKWKQYKLNDLGYTFSGLSGKSKKDFGHGKAQYVTYMNVFSNPIANLEMTEHIEIDNKQNSVKYNDIFFTTSSETPEEVGMSSIWLGKETNTYLNSFCFGFRLTKRIDSYYIAFMLRSPSFRRKMMVLAQGISRFNISKNKVMNIKILLPKISEQKRVGITIKKVDNTVKLQVKFINKIKKFRKFLLQNMFI